MPFERRVQPLTSVHRAGAMQSTERPTHGQRAKFAPDHGRLVAGVNRRCGVGGRRYGVRVTDSPILPVDDGLATTQVRKDLFCACLGFRLGVVMRACALRVWTLDVPAPIGVWHNMPFVSPGHLPSRELRDGGLNLLSILDAKAGSQHIVGGPGPGPLDVAVPGWANRQPRSRRGAA